jgi:hypothetical protein
MSAVHELTQHTALATTSTELPARLRGELDALPPSARVMLEGGWFNLQLEPVDPEQTPIPSPRANEWYIALVPESTTPQPFEICRTHDSSENGDWLVLDRFDFSDETRKMVEKLRRIRSAPTETQKQTLVEMLSIAKSLSERGIFYGITIFVGDLQLPNALRPLLATFLPENYRRLVEDAGLLDRFDLLAESHCRNQGTRGFERAVRYLDRVSEQQVYAEHGYMLIEEPDSHYICLVSDSIEDADLRHPPLIPVSRISEDKPTENKPTCGLIIAGKFRKIGRMGYTHLFTAYNQADDYMIGPKTEDGIYIAGHLFSDVPSRIISWVRPLRERPGEESVSAYDMRSFNQRGKASTDEIVREAYLRGQDLKPNPQMVDSCQSHLKCREHRFSRLITHLGADAAD